VPLDRLPVYVRSGAVIPLGPVMQHTGEKPVDPLSVHVYSFSTEETSGEARQSEFELYEDDGVSNDYEKGKFQRTTLRFEQSKDAVKFAIKAESGDGRYRAVPARSYKLRFHGLQDAISNVRLDGKEIARAEDADTAPAGAHWQLDGESGDVVVSLPRSSKRTFVVEFAAAPAESCGSC